MNSPTRSTAWRWWVCALLLCASTINYTDRVTLSTIATRISQQFALSQENYGTIETGFGLAFAFGSLMFGLIVVSPCAGFTPRPCYCGRGLVS